MADQYGKVDVERATEQWNALYTALRKIVRVQLIDPIPGLYDMVFAANAGFVSPYNGAFLVSKFNTNQREPEERYWTKWFYDDYRTVINQRAYAFEGAGDLLGSPSIGWFLGHGFRSTKLIANTITEFMGEDSACHFQRIRPTALRLVDPNFYHLDTCLCLLEPGSGFFYEEAFDEEAQQKLYDYLPNSFCVSQEEARKFACNAIVIDKDIFMPKCYSVADKLDKMGYNVHLFDMSEFIKAGGACKCLVLEITC
jgi:N-dimethylarginine dimethylaminohydrolase